MARMQELTVASGNKKCEHQSVHAAAILRGPDRLPPGIERCDGRSHRLGRSDDDVARPRYQRHFGRWTDRAHGMPPGPFRLPFATAIRQPARFSVVWWRALPARRQAILGAPYPQLAQGGAQAGVHPVWRQKRQQFLSSLFPSTVSY